MYSFKNSEMIEKDQALSGRPQAIAVNEKHHINGHPLTPPFPAHLHQAQFALGCFWGAERKFWSLDGVYTTAVGYSGGYTPNPTYEEVCSGLTGHTEAVLVVYDPNIISFQQLLTVFWETHDPTQGMRQGNDLGTQYRSAIYTYDEDQENLARQSKLYYEKKLMDKGFPPITTELAKAPSFYYAENYHQQYLAKNPNGYCGLGGTGVACSLEKTALTKR